MYALGAVVAYFLTAKIAEIKKSKITKNEISDAIFYAMIGGVLGGRIFYVFVYHFPFFAENPAEIFKVWHGGMSIHGGFLGGAAGLFWFSRRIKKNFWDFADLFAPAIALGLAFGRLGNFVNGELVGRKTDFFLGKSFDGRHPSQLYAVLKDLFLAGILLFFVLKRNFSRGKISAIFLILYGIFRFFVEFFRAPDPQLGLFFGVISMGQILSIFVFSLGVALFWHFSKKSPHNKKAS